MTTEYSGSGDPAKSLELMWGSRKPPSRGPKPGLTVDRIVRAAIEIADAEGLAAMSIRRVADALGTGTMTLYRYIPGKAELIDLMLDTVHGELAYVTDRESRGRWREGLEQVARELRVLYQRHPWLLQVATSRPPLGPNSIAKYDGELRTIDGIGLTDIEMDAVVTLITGYVHGAVRGAVEAAQAVQHTGMTDSEWWQAHEPLLAKIFDPEAYPVAARVGTAAGQEHDAAYNPEHAFEFGLTRILDGIDTLLTNR
jgi:AcrR family transcriptional regulator